MTVLVTGAGGQLGRAALRELGADGIGLRHTDLDVTDAAAVLAAAEHHQPTLILHAAAWTDVDGAETNRDGAYRANVLANRHVAEAAKAVPARLVTTCRELASHLRARHTAFYQRTADEAELLLSEERQLAKAEDLGRIDTFRFEESTVLEAALDALQQRQFRSAAQQGGVPSPLRTRLAQASARVAAHRLALARATASLDRAIDLILPGSAPTYGATGRSASRLASGSRLSA